ncbi:MAG: hypothetical protein QF830_05020 [Rhodospirillales bacterium]|nr:hypothetical protein [Rhodospirillales bacterium]MDP6883478.1 hypothetical protein [Rhodospirillales bacterium]
MEEDKSEVAPNFGIFGGKVRRPPKAAHRFPGFTLLGEGAGKIHMDGGVFGRGLGRFVHQVDAFTGPSRLVNKYAEQTKRVRVSGLDAQDAAVAPFRAFLPAGLMIRERGGE